MPHVIKILNHDLIEEKLKDALSKLYLKYLRERQTYGEGIMDAPEHSIALRRKRATGACNRVNSKRITYNYYTIAAEIDALDYLIVHELTHHGSHRHNKFFGNHVAKYVPNGKELKVKLNLRSYMTSEIAMKKEDKLNQKQHIENIVTTREISPIEISAQINYISKKSQRIVSMFKQEDISKVNYDYS